MKLDQYNEILQVIESFKGLSIKCSQYLQQKFPNVPSCTLDSILSLQVQNMMKIQYNQYKTEQGLNFLYINYLKSKENNEPGGIIVRMAEKLNLAPALTGKQVLTKHVELMVENGQLPGPNVNITSIVKRYMQDSTQIDDKHLAYEIFLCSIYDNKYGPIHEVVRGSVGQEYEIKLQRELEQMGVAYRDEEYMRKLGFDKTPDVKLDVPIIIDSFIINWIESKARFGNLQVHKEYIKSQYASYWNRFGPGLVIYWFGFIDDLDSNTENRFIIRDHLPKINLAKIPKT